MINPNTKFEDCVRIYSSFSISYYLLIERYQGITNTWEVLGLMEYKYDSVFREFLT